MRGVVICLCAGAGLALASGSAVLAEPDTARGEALAKRWCVSCHVVGSDQPGGDAGPSFASVAERIGQTAGEIETWLAEPHPPMPDPGLGAPEYRDLAAYIMLLRE